MTRITVYNNDGDTRLGWFDLDAAEVVQIEDTRWDGHNMRGVISGLQTETAALYRTKGGRWVENIDARREGGTETWRFLTDDEARSWIIASGADNAEDNLAKWFPDTPEEEGPAPQGGRPAIGPTINVAYPKELLDRIDAAAKEAKISRAAWLRQAAEKCLQA
ncbi:hypothetical protein [Streptomyces sp. NPDC050416]|uniref:hypothetical protein n=1 Tax=Streptomyces sp. NPDC050416 TaxID=3365611 RepID=UPI0037B65163